jgi:VIT1/CCC1 family predicted Fe2+/Mn2+ transporter
MWLYLHYSVIGPTFVVVGGGGGSSSSSSGSVYGVTRFISKDRNSLNNLNMGSLEEEVFYTGMATSIGSLFPVLCMFLFIWNKWHLLQ